MASSATVRSNVRKTGDTMLGSLIFKNTNLDNTDQSRTAATEMDILFRDKNDKQIGYIGSFMGLSGQIITPISASRYNGTTKVENYLQLQINKDFTKEVKLSDPAAWRSALGIADSGWLSYTNSSSFTGTIYYKKIGSLVEMIANSPLSLVNELNAGSSRTIGTLPSGYRPKAAALGSFYSWTKPSDYFRGELIISAGGDIMIYTAEKPCLTTYNLQLHCMYFIP